jgi:hypothetical protein
VDKSLILRTDQIFGDRQPLLGGTTSYYSWPCREWRYPDVALGRVTVFAGQSANGLTAISKDPGKLEYHGCLNPAILDMSPEISWFARRACLCRWSSRRC